MTINKLIDPSIPISLKVLIRACFGLLFVSPLFFRNGLRTFVSKNIRLHLLRIFLVTLAIGSTYFTYTKLPLTIAISIGFSGPIFTAILANLILKDRLQIGQWIAIFTGYIGVLLIIKPQGELNYAIYVSILGNIITGLSIIYVKKLLQLDSNNTIIIISNIGLVITTATWSIICWLISIYPNSLLHIVWHWPTYRDLKMLICMGFLGAISQLCNLKALQYASPAFLSPFEYSRLIIAIPIGIFLGEAFPTYIEIIGITIILIATVYNSWKGNRGINYKKQISSK